MGYEFDDDVPEVKATPPLISGDCAEIKTGGAASAATVTDIVCPVCFHQIEEPTIMADGADEFGRRLRTYFGYCRKCRTAHVVVQFAREERWVIHKYRPAVVLGMSQIINISDTWRIMSELPAPAPIMLGPGGDFKKPFTPELTKFAEKLREMRDAFGRLVESINEWLDDNK